jgi:lipopolysaccharide biosynthesis glycosyltransferase
MDFIHNNPGQINYFDQDALNVVLAYKWIEVPEIWNAHDLDQRRSMSDPAIVHFIGPKPWHRPMKHAFKHEYRRYRRKTPWPRYTLEWRFEVKNKAYRSVRLATRAMLPTPLRSSLRRRLLRARAWSGALMPFWTHEMEILCACDRVFLPHTATMLCSLLENNRVSKIHLFQNLIEERELTKLQSFVTKYGTELAAYKMDDELCKDLRVDGHASLANYYRLMAPLMLPANIQKILYLDSDIIVLRSLEELWNIDLMDQALAAVDDFWPTTELFLEKMKSLELPSTVRYFNSGVMLMNLNYWRQNNVGERAVAYLRENPTKVTYWDQDALNVILCGRWIAVPSIWNGQDFHRTRRSGPDVSIVHFIGEAKPWHWCWPSQEHPFTKEYRRYRRKTPWGRYSLDKRPSLIKSFARVVLSASLERWVRSHVERFRQILLSTFH